MKRMRTIPEAFAEIKSLDEKSSLTQNAIRLLCKQGKIRFVMIGTKYLVDLDNLIEFLNG
ncbi:MAG: DNA-binding protein [Clostridiales bacterium]|jgi:hypothetical protein|nr:DNA-binding protein [Clostridiales bacterium]